MRPSVQHPFAITMWDFSWLERRWPGAGYEDWDTALSELSQRGYDAVRIDAYPHLVSADPDKPWELRLLWNQTSWGAQSPITVTVMPALLDFIRAARRHGIGVALSTWFREDRDDVRMTITTPAEHARVWIDVLQHIDDAGLLDAILFVDLCNEFPLPTWAPFLRTGHHGDDVSVSKTDPRLISWMRESIDIVRGRYPDLDYTYSFNSEFETWADLDVSMLDVLEPHIWMAMAADHQYNRAVGYHFEKFDPTGFENLVKNGRNEYEQNRDHYDRLLFDQIDRVADWSRASQLGVYTTECWAIVDYKDWPGLDWDWVLDLNARAVEYAAATGRWLGIATSNFCGPQFVGMWREVEWHQRLTTTIKSAPIDADIAGARRHRSQQPHESQH